MDAKNFKMLRCIELARNGIGNTLNNPMVGALIDVDKVIVGEGYHQKYGSHHAEVNAINAVKDPSLLKLSTLYVNLEPCSHYGKTPPCAELIIKKEIPRVVVGMSDPFDKVSGRGIEMLRNAGVEVEVGVMEAECRELNKRFITFCQKKRPYIILKWAETADGLIDIDRTSPTEPQPNWITDELARVLVHKWRTEERAILVGTNTALYDNPKLTSRDWYGHNPLRMVIDRSNRLPHQLAVFNNEAETLLFSDSNSKINDNCTSVKAELGDAFPHWFANYCFEQNINSVIIEGGATLLQYFINAGMWDEARVFKGNILFGKGVKAPILELMPISETKMKNSSLYFYKNE